MLNRKKSTDTTLPILLAMLTGIGLVGCVAAAALLGMGRLPSSALRVTGIAVGIAAFSLALLRLLLEIADRRSAADFIGPASELTTLTFAPTPRVQRPQRTSAKGA
jgi:hypothetical protein